MKLAIVGGAGVRVPLLIKGLVNSDLPIHHVSLFDIETERLAQIAALTRLFAKDVNVTTHAQSIDAITGADFVFTSMRVGGIAARAQDEAACLSMGLIGQETVGPAGFAMAMRTIPEIVKIAKEIERTAPNAWMINFTNPVGIITQAISQASQAKVIGICDTPTELFEEVAHVLGVPSAQCHFDYLGINHLGFLREVYVDGSPQLHRVFEDEALLTKVYRAPLFSAAELRDLRLLPTEYVYYYLHTKRAVESLKKKGTTRGTEVGRLNHQLFADLKSNAVHDHIKIYETYLHTRNASYMQLETGQAAPLAISPLAHLTGYDKIALHVVRGIHHNLGHVLPLNVKNKGNIASLDQDAVVEVPCTVTGNGALPLHTGDVPSQVRGLLTRVKHYETLTVKAAMSRSPSDIRQALIANPLLTEADADKVLPLLRTEASL